VFSLQDAGLDITANALHPGNINTSLYVHETGFSGAVVAKANAWFGKTVPQVSFSFHVLKFTTSS